MSSVQAKDAYRLDRLTRVFPGVVAVDQADIAVRRGEVHGIIGKNGAGKSVLVSMLAGIIPPTSGSITIGETQVGRDYSPAKAHALGVSLIPQEPLFAPDLTVSDNLFMGRPAGGPLGLVDQAARDHKVAEIGGLLNVQTRSNQPMGTLRIEDQQLLAFGKALYLDHASIILLDEITASLTRERKLLLLQFLRQEVAKGTLSITLITHHIREVLEFCDRVTVMRDGRVVHTGDVAAESEHSLARWIVGDAPDTVAATKNRKSGETVLSVRGLSRRGEFANVDLDLAAGDVVGLAGLDGSGKDAFLAALFGLLPPQAGSVAVGGRTVRIRSPRDGQRHGLAYLPKKREEQAIVHSRSVEENLLLSAYGALSSRFGLIDRKRGRDIAQDAVLSLNVKTPSLHTDIDTLSGGNRQKVVVGRVATMRPNVFLLDEPTRGVDLGAKPQILTAIRDQLAATGGVLVTSESEEELVAICDRVLVFYRGSVLADLSGPEMTVARIYAAAQGIEQR